MKSKQAKESLKEKARRTISDAIMNGKLKPGDQIDRRSVAKKLNMSVAPVLEAMLLLTEEGMIETKPRSGTRVKAPDRSEVLGRYLIREAVECQVARIVYGKRISDNWNSLVGLAEEVDKCKAISLERWRAEIDFHCALADLVGQKVFSTIFRKLVRANLFFELQATERLNRNAPFLSHVRLLERLRDAKTPDEAEEIARGDMRNGKDILLKEI